MMMTQAMADRVHPHPRPAIADRAAGIALLLLAGSAMPAAAEDVMDLGTLVVTATRTGQNAYDTLAPSTGISRERLQLEEQGGSVADILTLVPGVTTQTTASDPGTGVNIRGLQDFGRVNVMIDGARQNFQKNGHEANGTFYFDT